MCASEPGPAFVARVFCTDHTAPLCTALRRRPQAPERRLLVHLLLPRRLVLKEPMGPGFTGVAKTSLWVFFP